jgi:hypothetical protein
LSRGQTGGSRELAQHSKLVAFPFFFLSLLDFWPNNHQFLTLLQDFLMKFNRISGVMISVLA